MAFAIGRRLRSTTPAYRHVLPNRIMPEKISAFCQKQNIVMNVSWIPHEVTASTVAAVKRLNSNAETANAAMAKRILMGGNSSAVSRNRQCSFGNPQRNVPYRFSGELKSLAD